MRSVNKMMGGHMRFFRAKAAVVLLSLLCGQSAHADVKKVTLFVNYGEGAILHSGAVQSFVNMMTALKTEKAFTLTISQQTDPAAQKQAALNEMKNQDVVLFANIGANSFTNVADQAVIQTFFRNGGKGIGYHASSDSFHGGYWPWWTDSLHNGAYFVSHADQAFVLNTDPELNNNIPLKKMWDDNSLGNPSIAQTEIYALQLYPRGKPGITIMQNVAPPNTVHEFTWLKKFGTGGGEYIYTCLGHGPNDFVGDWLKKATWAYMQYLNGKYAPTSLKPSLELNSNSVNFAANKLDVRFANAYSVRVYDVKGETAFARNGRGIQGFDLAGMQPGLYFIKIKSAKASYSVRALIK